MYVCAMDDVPHEEGVRCLVGLTVNVYDSSVSRFRDWSKE